MAQITALYPHSLPGPFRTFSAKAEAIPELALTTMYDMRGYRRRRGLPFIVLLKGLLHGY